MLFHSLAFAVFLVLVFASYWLLVRRGNVKLRNFFLLAVSYLFYGWWDARFLILIFITSAADYYFSNRMEAAAAPRKKKALLLLSLSLNLGLLGFFKYFDFFAQSLQTAFGSIGIVLDDFTLGIVVPAGISFYTFQEIAYNIDVYRGDLKASKDPIAFFAFVAFFPQLVAGPIERARDLLPQFSSIKPFDYAQAVTGLRLILWGFFKKIVIADVLAEYVDVIFKHPQDFYGLDIALGAVFFTIQVYCDFSGYSDIAIGTGRLFNFSLSRNFKTPLFSRSIREWFQRWHISLMSWFRDYLYFPLGGSRVAPTRKYLNLFIVFFLSGLWHGAENHYVIWGAFLGIWVVVESGLGFGLNQSKGLTAVMSGVITFSAFTLSMIFFRSLSVTWSFTAIQHVFTGDFFSLHLFTQYQSDLNLFMSDGVEMIYISVLLIFLLLVDFQIWLGDFSEWIGKFPRWTRWSAYYMLILWLLLLGGWTRPQVFVYFQF